MVVTPWNTPRRTGGKPSASRTGTARPPHRARTSATPGGRPPGRGSSPGLGGADEAVAGDVEVEGAGHERVRDRLTHVSPRAGAAQPHRAPVGAVTARTGPAAAGSPSTTSMSVACPTCTSCLPPTALFTVTANVSTPGRGEVVGEAGRRRECASARAVTDRARGPGGAVRWTPARRVGHARPVPGRGAARVERLHRERGGEPVALPPRSSTRSRRRGRRGRSARSSSAGIARAHRSRRRAPRAARSVASSASSSACRPIGSRSTTPSRRTPVRASYRSSSTSPVVGTSGSTLTFERLPFGSTWP
jgi:hypothetical protein